MNFLKDVFQQIRSKIHPLRNEKSRDAGVNHYEIVATKLRLSLPLTTILIITGIFQHYLLDITFLFRYTQNRYDTAFREVK